MTAEVLEKRIADAAELIEVVREELNEAKNQGDHHEAFLLQRELGRALDNHRRMSAELHLMHHPKKRADYRPKKVRCPDCGHWTTEDALEAMAAATAPSATGTDG